MVDSGTLEMGESTAPKEVSTQVIVTRGLEKSYVMGRGEVMALSGVDLEVAHGEMVAVMGVSGAGKTTLLHLLGALDRPTKGEVILEGKNLSDCSEIELARLRNQHVGFVFQFHHLLPEFSGLENVMIPGLLRGARKKEVEEQAKELLSRMGLADRWSHRPGELSGGEQQRVAIARALINNPSIVLADEPTGNLDSSTAETIFELLREINERSRQTILVATHNASMAEKMDRVIAVVDGKIAQKK
ncbi:MAG: ABC transporter ATP-binding protein [Nitrospinae bacterium]|nr:ABC transporter ATP-binding protein [Nitrospinota bacterium]